MTPEQAAALRSPFPAESIGKIPKAGMKLDYVGHAVVTDRLLSIDPDWTWEPGATHPQTGAPVISDGGLWIKLTVCGVTRYGWGDGPDIKQMISDAIRNAAMRFGVALDLWSKEELESSGVHTSDVQRPSPPMSDAPVEPAPGASAPDTRATPAGGANAGPEEPPPVPSGPAISKARREKLKSRCVSLQADGVSVADAREALHLPLVDSCDLEQIEKFEAMVDDLERTLAAPFAEAKT